MKICTDQVLGFILFNLLIGENLSTELFNLANYIDFILDINIFFWLVIKGIA